MHDTPIQCLVVDDEPQAREVIKKYIDQIPILQLAGECKDAVEAIRFLHDNTIDILFLDIHMPQLKGTDLLKVLKPAPKVILTTAYPDYALEGYELDVIDYLLKPIQYNRFLKAVQKTIQLKSAFLEPVADIQVKSQKEPFAYFRVDRKMVKVIFDEIFYVESMKDYIKVVTTKGTLVTKQSISSVEAMLPDTQFIRTHRSFIVSLNKIKSYTSELIDLGETEIPIGKLYRNSVLNAFT